MKCYVSVIFKFKLLEEFVVSGVSRQLLIFLDTYYIRVIVTFLPLPPPR